MESPLAPSCENDSCSCSSSPAHSDAHDSDAGSHKNKLYAILGALLLLGTALIVPIPNTLRVSLYIAGYLLAGWDVLWRAGRNLGRLRLFDENFLMSVATLGAFAIGEFPEGVSVMLFYQFGEWIQESAVRRSRKSIQALMEIRPDYANLKDNDQLRRVHPSEVGVGDIIVVKPGEKIPLDGRVSDGYSQLDMAALTGESAPKDIEPGTEVYSGSMNLNGVLTIEVQKMFGESTVSKILELVQNAGNRKAPSEKFITKFARIYTPVVVLIALALALLPPLLMPDATFREWVYRALVFLVVSCPCALVISIPLSFFGGLGGASKNGILIKGSHYLEALNKVDTAVFDKTGTLTTGQLSISKIMPAEGFSEAQLLECAAHAEGFSSHPVARSILNAYGKDPEKSQVSEVEEVPGFGIKAAFRGKNILSGNAKLLRRENISFSECSLPGTHVYIAVEKRFAGCILLSDDIKKDSPSAISQLRALGVRNIFLLTGDNEASAKRVGEPLGLNGIFADLLPHEKVARAEQIKQSMESDGKLIFVGDGINDAPVLAISDIGIAMGALGSDAAIEAADIVLMTDEPSRVATALEIAAKTRRIVWQNVFLALFVKGGVLLLGAGGIATMWEAVFADVGVALLAILNATRVMRMKQAS